MFALLLLAMGLIVVNAAEAKTYMRFSYFS
jgi:hypothetical protein